MIAGFCIEEFVGAGAMAVVYRAVQVNLARPVALKILPREFSRSRDYVDRFFNEARAAAAISHPNIVRAYDAGIDENDICYFAMEFIEGETVLDRIVREQRIPVLDGLQIAIHISEALDYGWRTHRLTHGDIKPANLMINTRGEAKLADFGLAKVAEIEDVSGSVMLTPLYACPEIIQGYQPVEDCRPDIYAFGATLYHMLAGSPPFPGDDSKEVMRMQVEAALPPLNKINGEVPRSVSDFVSAMLRKDPDKRVQSWSDVTSGLNEAMGDLTRRGTVTVAKATKVAPPTAAGAASPGLHIHRQTIHKAVSPSQKGENHRAPAGGVVAGLMILLILLLAVLGVMKMRSAPSPPASPPPETAKPTAPGISSPGISPNQQHWQRLHGALARESSAAARIRLLEQFAANGHAESDPARFNAMISEERRAWRQERLQNRPGNRPHRPPPPPDPAAEPPLDPGHPDRTPPPLSPEQAAAREREMIDAYTGLVFAAASYEMSLVAPPAELLAAARAWQERFPDDSSYAQRVALLADTVIPAFLRMRSVMIANKDIFTGLQLPNMDDRIRSIEISGVPTVVAVGGGTGRVERTLSWTEVGGGSFVKAFARQLLTKKDPTPDEIRTALSCMLFDRAVTAIESLARQLPAEEARLWQLLAGDVAAAPREQAVLNQIAALRQSVDDRRFLGAHAILAEIARTPSFAKQRHAAELTDFTALVRPNTPEGKMDNLLEQANKEAADNPREALALVSAALSRYGGLQSPLKTELKTLSEQIVKRLAADLESEGDPGDFHTLYTPFVRPSATRLGRPLAALQLCGSRGTLPEDVVRCRDAFDSMAWIEAGNWDAGLAQSASLAANKRANLSRTAQFQLALADCMVRSRRGESTAAILDAQISELMGLAGDAATNSPQAGAVMQFAIVSERLARGRQLLWANPGKLGVPPAALLTLAETAMALHLTEGDLAQAGQISVEAGRLLRSQNEADQWFDGSGRTLLWLGRQLGQAVEEGDDAPASSQHKFRRISGSPGGRWILYMLATREIPAPKDKRELLKMLAAPQNLVAPLDGKRFFDMLLGEVAEHLAKGEFGGAADRVSAFLELTSPCLAEYYPRLLALKAGIQILDQQPAQAQETLKALESASVASPAEKKWVDYAKRSPAERVARRGPGKPPEGDIVPEQAYWESWLNCCYWRTLGGRNDTADREAAVMRDLTCVPGKRLLAMAMLDVKLEPNASK